MSVFRCYSQKMPGFDVEAQGVCKALQEQLGISALKSVAILNRYDADQIDPAVYEQAKGIVFSEPMVDVVYDETFPATDAAWRTQLVALAVGVLIYALGTCLVTRKAVRIFEQVDL